MYTITNEHLSASINPVGAELSSLKFHQQEFLWQGDPKTWAGRAPILFPIVGALKNNQMRYRDKHYQLNRHGFARTSTFDQVMPEHIDSGGSNSDTTDTKAAQLSLLLASNPDTLKQYPWEFELRVHFQLNRYGIEIRYEVINRDTDSMLFTIGSHPAFRLPLDNNLSLNDYDVHFNKTESLTRLLLNDEGLLTEPGEDFPAHNNAIALDEHLFDQDALIFKNIQSDRVTLRCQQQPRLTVNTGGAPHIGLWAKPGAPYVCIEPWFGISDSVDSDGDFSNKPDLKMLEPGETFNHTISISLSESTVQIG